MFAFLQSPEDARGQRPKIRPVNENATVPVTITRHSLPPADAEETGLTLCTPIPLRAYRLLCWISLYETQQSGGLSVADDNVPEEPEDGTPGSCPSTVRRAGCPAEADTAGTPCS
jgi:hypothetical protein